MVFKIILGHYDVKNNEINICLKKINNLLELKENVDREMQMVFEAKINKKDLTNVNIYLFMNRINNLLVVF